MTPQKPDDELRDQAFLAAAIDSLGEHFDSVAIFVTRHESSKGGTLRLIQQSGNLYATVGWVRDWIIALDAIGADRAVEADRSKRSLDESEQ